VRLVTLDIETRPSLVHVWGLWEQNVGLNQIVEVGTVICFAAKWHGESKVHFHSDHHDGHEQMVQKAWEFFDAADAMVTYNGKAFDVKHLQREFVLAGLAPPSPHKDIDLLTVARGRFKFASNKLEHVASELGIGHKMQTGGFELWRDCMKDDPKAWATMRRYNIQDVRLTEQVYDRLLPWIKNHPNVNLYRRDRVPDNGAPSPGCPTCGSPDVMRRGKSRTISGMYQRWQCQACGAWSRSTHRDDTTSRVGVA
jgi:predicted RNA-binding Zn-ribbon protein involved in translation (DUF1610 family)